MKNEVISIIIITYNAMRWVDKCLSPLQEVPANAKVYIIDNGSTDGTQDFIKTNFKSFNFYQSKKNLGFGKANNLGFEMALKDGCTHFLLLNQDAHITWENVFKLAQLQKENTEFGIISPLQLYNDDRVDFLHLKSLMKESYTFLNDLICHNNMKDVYEITYTNAAIWMLSKACLKKVGGFDPIFPHYGEDKDLSNRVNFFNLKVGLAPFVKAFHLRKQDLHSKKKSKKEHYVKFLVRAKKLDKNTSFVSLRIMLELIKGLFSKSSNLGGLASWQAFIKFIGNLQQIIKHKKINKESDYTFLKF